MANFRHIFSIVLALLSLCPACLLSALGQRPDKVYVCGKNFCKPFSIAGIGAIRFNDSTMLVGARRFHNADLDSLAFQRPASAYLDAVGQTETVKAAAGAALLDITRRTGEVETATRNVYSAWYMLNVAGLPFTVTTSLDSALMGTRLVVVSSVVSDTTFTAAELQQLSRWVNDGGKLVLIATTPGEGSALTQLVGYGSARDFSQRKQVAWNMALDDKPEFGYIDTDEEQTIIVGRNSALRSYHFQDLTETADTLATTTYGSDLWVVAVRHRVGSGTVYSYGFPWALTVQQAQLGKDSYKRTNNNHYEPSADAVALQLRSIYCHEQQPAVWKFTIPDGYESVLIPTHDCDSKTALDSMYFMSEYEKSLGASCHYFITTHYYAEPQDTGEVRLGEGYTPERVPKVRQLLSDGHTVGSHSIGHFPDFSVAARFPMTVTTRDDYHALYSNRTQQTTGGSTWAEVVLSKLILEGDLGNHVQSFRTGHLCMNDSIPHAEQIGGYHFASCYTAHDMRSEFPFQERLGNVAEGSFNGVLEMPLHFSDVFNSKGDEKMGAGNWQEKVEIWKGIHKKLAANYAPGIVLIHPNRKWKMEAEKMLVDTYDHDRVGIYNFEAYGRFWNTRSATGFTYGFDASRNVITIRLDRELDDYGLLPFAIEGLSAGSLPAVHLTSPDNVVVAIGQLKPTAVTGRYICVF